MNAPNSSQKPLGNPNNTFANGGVQNRDINGEPPIDRAGIEKTMQGLAIANVALKNLESKPESVKLQYKEKFALAKTTLIEQSKTLLQQWAIAGQLPYLAKHGVVSSDTKQRMLKVGHELVQSYIEENYPTFGLK